MPFLMAIYFEEIYMDLPLGYNKRADFGNQEDQLVCKLHKLIYGLKQSSRQWFSKFSSVLIDQGFSQSKSDYSLFIKGSSTSFLGLLVYVDNIVLTKQDQQVIVSLKTFLHSQFKLKDLRQLKYFLGLEIFRLQKGIFQS